MLFSKLVRKVGCMSNHRVTIRKGVAYINGKRVDVSKPMYAQTYSVEVALVDGHLTWISFPNAIKIVRTTKQQVVLQQHVQDLLDASRDARA